MVDGEMDPRKKLDIICPLGSYCEDGPSFTTHIELGMQWPGIGSFC